MTTSASDYVAVQSPGEISMQPQPGPTKTALEHFREYGQQRPEVVALWCFGIGFLLGWRLKPW
jgi:hypothetical protein